MGMNSNSHACTTGPEPQELPEQLSHAWTCKHKSSKQRQAQAQAPHNASQRAGRSPGARRSVQPTKHATPGRPEPRGPPERST